MQGDKKVLVFLNKLLAHELTAINQYFLHARMYRNWGYEELDEHLYDASITEMKQADKLIERILFLEGLPNLQQLNKLLIGEHPREMIECDLQQVMAAVAALREAIAYCESCEDFVTRDLCESILKKEEDFVDWLETQLNLIDSVGLENYLQSQIDD